MCWEKTGGVGLEENLDGRRGVFSSLGWERHLQADDGWVQQKAGECNPARGGRHWLLIGRGLERRSRCADANAFVDLGK